MGSLLEVSNLKVSFHGQGTWSPVVNNVDFKIERGQTLGLVGESGSGKSITSLSILGLLPNQICRVDQGTINFQGVNLLSLPEQQMRTYRGNRISMIFQEPMTSLNPIFTVGSQIVEGLKIHKKMGRKEAWEHATHLLNRVGFENAGQRMKSYPHQLSGGQRQRVMIAMAIACEPDLLIADEPTTALDMTIQKQVIDLLLSLQQDMGMSLLFITHDLGLVAQVADEVVVMRHGQIMEKGSKQQIFLSPQSEYTKALLHCRPPIDHRPLRLPTLSDFNDRSVELKREEKLVKCEPAAMLVEVQNISKSFVLSTNFLGQPKSYIQAVDQVSLNIAKGGTLGIVGESGSGKTTLGRTILRLIEPSSGQIKFSGQDITRIGAEQLRKLRRNMQIIFQDPYASLNPRMSIGQAIYEPLSVHQIGENSKERWNRVADLMSKVGLNPDWKDRHPHQLSGGQRQRVCIARALSVEPQFIVCDESVSSLDVSVQAQILNLLSDLQDEYGLTYMFISHDLAVVRYMADDLAVMKDGRIVESGRAAEIYKNPKAEYTQQLFDAIPAKLF